MDLSGSRVLCGGETVFVLAWLEYATRCRSIILKVGMPMYVLRIRGALVCRYLFHSGMVHVRDGVESRCVQLPWRRAVSNCVALQSVNGGMAV